MEAACRTEITAATVALLTSTHEVRLPKVAPVSRFQRVAPGYPLKLLDEILLMAQHAAKVDKTFKELSGSKLHHKNNASTASQSHGGML